jgi:membrane associated rhomboid family serine protease
MFIPVGDNVERRSFPVLSALLVSLNLLVFSYQVRLFVHNPHNLRPSIDFINHWGLVPADLIHHRYVGVVTHMFLHGGVSHILGNMICLWAFACSLEIGFGAMYLLSFYVFWGVAGGLAHAYMHWGAATPLVGASGAIAGLMGAYAALYGTNTKIRCVFFFGFKPIFFNVPAMAFCLGWFAMQLLNARIEAHLGDSAAGVAWYAHIGGFALGFVTALIVKNEMKCELITQRDGTLTFKERGYDPMAGKYVVDGVALEYAENDLDGRGSPLPEACPHCGQAVEEKWTITPVVARCANAACARLIYAGMQHA